MPFTAELVDLNLNAVALCNQGANARADIIFMKRKEQKSMPTTFEELMKSLNPDQAKLITDHVASLTKSSEETIARLEKSVKELEAKVDGTGTEEPDIMKSLPAEVQKRFDDMQNALNAMVAKQAEDLAAQRFEKCKALPVAEADLKEVLKSASPAVVSILEKAATALVEKTHTAVGSEAAGEIKKTGAAGHYETLEKSAKDIMAQNAGMTFEKAFTLACERDPDTYTKYAQGV